MKYLRNNHTTVQRAKMVKTAIFCFLDGLCVFV